MGHFVLNGELVVLSEARISLYSLALFSSFGVYESIAIEQGRPFHLHDHLERLVHSAEIIDLPIGYTVEVMRDWVHHLIKHDGITESLLRVIVFGPNSDEQTLVYVLPGPLPRYPEEFYHAGASAITYDGSRRPLPQAKTLNTLVNYLALRQARKAGAHEAFLVHADGCVTEGSRSNLFAVREAKLITPPADEVVSGITRQLVCQLAAELGIAIAEENIPASDLLGVDEVFVTSTSMHVIPIVRVDGQQVGEGHVGPITRRLIDEFEAHYRAALNSAAP